MRGSPNPRASTRFEVGQDARLYADVGRAIFFDPSGKMVAG